MIVDYFTYNSVPNPDRPRYVPEYNPSNTAGDAAFLAAVSAVVGLLAGLVTLVIADSLFLGGAGMDEGTTEATFREGAPYFFSPVVLFPIIVVAWFYFLPKRYKTVYFTTHQHETAYKQFMGLDAGARPLAQDAYDAIAAFDAVDDYGTDQAEYELFKDAWRIWSDTYDKVRRMNAGVDMDMHRDRIEQAERSLKILSD